jgi:hypothetical protein
MGKNCYFRLLSTVIISLKLKAAGASSLLYRLLPKKYFLVLTFFMRKYFAISEKSCIFAIEIEKEYKRKQRTSYENID